MVAVVAVVAACLAPLVVAAAVAERPGHGCGHDCDCGFGERSSGKWSKTRTVVKGKNYSHIFVCHTLKKNAEQTIRHKGK